MKPVFVGLCGTGRQTTHNPIWSSQILTLLSPHLLPYQTKIRTYTLTTTPDLHEYLGGPSIIPTTPHPLTKESLPLTLGHEFSGTVEEVGRNIQDIKAGDRVCVQPIIYDETCSACLEGHVNCCLQNGFIGLSGVYQMAL